jgi:hypothetical protein
LAARVSGEASEAWLLDAEINRKSGTDYIGQSPSNLGRIGVATHHLQNAKHCGLWRRCCQSYLGNLGRGLARRDLPRGGCDLLHKGKQSGVDVLGGHGGSYLLIRKATVPCMV